MIVNLLSLLFTLSCKEGKTETVIPTAVDEKAVYEGEVPLFSEAVLLPEPSHVNASWAGVGLLDYDGDGWLDIFLPNGENAPDALYKNMGNGEFIDVAEDAGVASLKANGGVAVGDFDNDGDPDMVVNTVCSTGTWLDEEHVMDSAGGLMDGGKILYENLGNGQFQEKEFALFESERVFLERCTVSITPVDVNHDGFLDLVFANGHDPDIAPPWIFDKNAEISKNFILLNNRAGNFDRMHILEGNRTTFATGVMDINQDGEIDLIQAQGGGPLDVFLGQGMEEFSLSRFRSHAGRGLWMGLTVADFNRDGALDLFTTNQGLSTYINGYDNTVHFFPGEEFSDFSNPELREFRELSPFHSIHYGQNGEFSAPAEIEVQGAEFLAGDLFHAGSPFEIYEIWEQPKGLERYAWSWGTVSLDVNADGWMDIIFTSNNGSSPLDIINTEERGAGAGALLVSTGAGQFFDLTEESGIGNIDEAGNYVDGRGVATGDLNNDGYPDVVFANRTYTPSLSNPLAQTPGRARVWLSEPREGGWLRIQLQGNGEDSPRDALGATVWVEEVGSAESARIYAYGAGGETCSTSEHALYVGLGDWEKVNVRARFPSGIEVSQAEVMANSAVLIEEVR